MSKRLPPRALDAGAVPWLLVVALATAGPHAEHLPAWLSTLFAGALAWRGWLWTRQHPLPRPWIVALIVAGSVGGIVWQYRTLLGKDPGVALLVVFMALKPLEMNTRRDAMVVVLLGYFLLLTHYLYSQSIVTGVWLLLTMILLPATLIRLHGGSQPVPAIARLAGALLLQALPLMLILFLLFPRISGPLWGLPQDAYSALSGLSNQMSPGSISRLIQSGAIAFRTRFADEVPAKSELYWRGPVFNAYDGLTWRAQTPSPAPPTARPQVEGRGRMHAYTSLIEPHNERWLLALDVPTTLPADATLGPMLQAFAREPLRARSRQSFVSALDYRANVVETPTILHQAVELPAQINPRARALAASWRALSAEQIVANALAMFGREDFAYTLQPPLLGTHAMDEFLFVTRRGFCEHYASAFVFLMRAAGVPARVVAGYQGGEINPVDDYLTVRQSDAHAWAEVWLAGRGWVRVDPTAAVAPARIERGIAAALPEGEPLPAVVRLGADWLRHLRHRWEAAGNAWNQWVLGYNPQRQREVLSRLGLPDPDWRKMTASLAMLSGLALLVVVVWTLPRQRAQDPVRQAWLRFCQALARRGLVRAEWEGPLAFAQRVADEQPELAGLTGEAANCYVALRYGHPARDDLRRLQQCVNRLRNPRRADS
ncbi:MAG: DUF3488 domain-containing protein [Dokdonella sp.]|nr:MAG: DUF3488 domain-containing protein [Dokdonella sp.]